MDAIHHHIVDPDRKPVKNILPKRSALQTAIIVVATAFAGTLWTWGDPVSEKMIAIRYVLFGFSALAAFITPYLLFPDKYRSVMQLANPDGSAIWRHLYGKMNLIVLTGAVLLIFMALGGIFSGSGKFLEIALPAAGSILFLSAILRLACYRYLQSGPDSQFWSESEKGRRYRKKAADLFKYPLDPGSIPSLMNTVLIFLTGSLLILLGTILFETVSIWSETLLYCIFYLFTYIMIQRQRMSVVRYYYSTNAFFGEFFRENQDGDVKQTAPTADQLWWVPARLQPHVWQLTLQTDRILPAGRMIAAGHAAMLFIAYQNPGADLLLMLWAGFALLHHLLIPLSARADVAPGWLTQWVAGFGIMVLSRAWMQVRWVLPLLVGMNLQYFIFGIPGFRDQLIILLFYLVTALLTAGLQHLAGSNFKMTAS